MSQRGHTDRVFIAITVSAVDVVVVEAAVRNTRCLGAVGCCLSFAAYVSAHLTPHTPTNKL